MKSRKPAIPPEIRAEVERIIAEFNREHLAKYSVAYSARFRGKYVYVDREGHGDSGPIFRLAFNGAMDNWDFAIYKYSDERYDSEEWFFRGVDEVDGTVEGALRAGLMAYPI